MLQLCEHTNLDDCVTVGLWCSLPRLSYSYAHSSPSPLLHPGPAHTHAQAPRCKRTEVQLSENRRWRWLVVPVLPVINICRFGAILMDQRHA